MMEKICLLIILAGVPLLLSTTIMAQTMCPNVTGLVGACYERCSDDDECSDGQLCCSNGCGHDCMDPVLDCSTVPCWLPTCTSPSVLATPKGSCCPVCAGGDKGAASVMVMIVCGLITSLLLR